MALLESPTAAPSTVLPAAAGATARRTLKDSIVPLIGGIAILYFGREFLIPLALAILLAFLLAPLVLRLERWKLHRVPSVVIVTLLAFSLLAGLGYLVGGQLIDLADKIPGYKSNLQKKVQSLKVSSNSPFSRAKETLQDVTKELTETPAKPTFPKQPGVPETIGQQTPLNPSNPLQGRALQLEQPVPVAIVAGPTNAIQSIEKMVTPILAPLGTAAIVIVFVIFILLEREDLRDRIIHLVGRGHLQVTTQALDEASSRVSRYLLAQLIVNVTYGIPVGIFLAILGIPNAVLWGLLATVLRFVPYIGPWMAAAFPVALSLATSDTWSTPLMVIGFILVMELISNNVVEPWLYGSSTGLSPMAVIVSAAFWTWLWGTIGLLLATPLTVCIVVLGKYIPQFSFLDVLLGDKPPIAEENRFYQRLLAMDEDEVSDIAENYCAKHSLVCTFDKLIIPAMRMADEDFRRGTLDEKCRERVFGIARDLAVDLGPESKPVRPLEKGQTPDVVCVSASDFADELVCLMLARLLGEHELSALIIPSSLLASETTNAVAATECRLIAVSALPPGSTRHAIYVTRRLRVMLPEARILVGIWGEAEGDDRRTKRLDKEKVEGVYTTLQVMVNEIVATAEALPSTPTAAPEPLAAAPETKPNA